jgi:ferredoxin
MINSDIYFEIDDGTIAGSVPLGTIVRDALARSGVAVSTECDFETAKHVCEVGVVAAIDLLSPMTQLEERHFTGSDNSNRRRLACEAVFVLSGDCTIVTTNKETDAVTGEGTENSDVVEKLVKEFGELPLEQKAAALLKMEATALGETINFVMNSPYDVAGKIGDILAEFGMKKEKAAEASRRPTSEPVVNPEPVITENEKGAD